MRERSGGSCVFALIAAMGMLFFGASNALAGTSPDLNADTIGCFDVAFGGGSTAIWYLRDQNSTGEVSQWTPFGAPGTTMTPVVGNWLDGNVVTGLGLWEWVNATTGNFYVKDDPTTGGPADDFVTLLIDTVWAPDTDPIPLAGNFGGAGVPGVGYYYPDSGVFVIDTNPGNGTNVPAFEFGPKSAGNIHPVVGDWDGNGTDTIGVYDATTAVWYLKNDFTAGPVNGFQFGPPASGWIPVAGNWDLLGGDSVGFYDPANAVFKLRNTNDGGTADIQAALGAPGGSCQPVAGNWNLSPP